jgi:hypothetical protein
VVLTRKMLRQPNASTSAPPIGGPTIARADVAEAQIPNARARSRPSKIAVMMASEPGTRRAPVIPWRRRATARTSSVGASPQASDVTPNPTRPMTKTRRRPYRSPRAPARRRNAASVAMYPATT